MKNIYLIPVIFLFTVLATHISYSQEGPPDNLIWSYTYPYEGGGESHGYSIQQTTDGGYIICGTVVIEEVQDIYVLKLDAEGNTEWSKNIGGEKDDVGYSIKQCSDEGFIIAGQSSTYGSGDNFDFFLVKLDHGGEIEWTQSRGDVLDEGSYSVTETLDEGFLAVGYTYSEGQGGSDVQAIKFDGEGNEEWATTYGGENDETGYGVAQLRDSGFVICGNAIGYSAEENVYLIRTDKNGEPLWENYYGDEVTQCAYSIYACEETGYVVAGKTSTTENGDDVLMMKIFDDGTLIWTKTYGGEGDEVAYDVKETQNYGFTLVGSTTSYEETGQDIYMVHTDDFGGLVWDANYGDTYSDEGRAVCITEDNNIAFTGTVTGGSGPVSMLYGAVVNLCDIVFPRGLWFSECWRFEADLSQNQDKYLLIDDANKTWTDKKNEFVEYCIKAKIHTVILHALQDLLREDNGTTFTGYQQCNTLADGSVLRGRLKALINDLHYNGMVVLASWHDAFNNYDVSSEVTGCNFSSTYDADEDVQAITNNLEILDAFITLNNPLSAGSLGFDGLNLDYEYFSPFYGGAPNDFSNACTGFKDNWLPLATAILEAKYNYPATGVKIAQAYLNAVVFTSPDQITNNVFSYDNNCAIGTGSDTDIDDSKAELWDIDILNFNGAYFDALCMVFQIDDDMDAITPYQNDDPTSFLTGVALPNNDPSALQRMRHRLQILGNDPSNTKTRVIPYFRSRGKGPGNCGDPSVFLGELLLGSTTNCYWSTDGWPTSFNPYQPYWINPFDDTPGVDHYLSEIEIMFILQFLSQFNEYPNPDPYDNFGNVTIYGGFQWYQYGLGATPDPYLVATSYDALIDGGNILRPGDAVNATYGCNALRTANPFYYNLPFNASISSSNAQENESILISENLGNVNFRVTDMLGRDVTASFNFKKDKNNLGVLIEPVSEIRGLYLLTIPVVDGQNKIIPISIIK